MSKSLRERLLGQRPTGTNAAVPAAAGTEPLPGAGQLSETYTVARVDATDGASGMFGPRKSDDVALSMVDELKRELHRKLIDRLDLEALELVTDERQVAAQIRHLSRNCCATRPRRSRSPNVRRWWTRWSTK